MACQICSVPLYVTSQSSNISCPKCLEKEKSEKLFTFLKLSKSIESSLNTIANLMESNGNGSSSNLSRKREDLLTLNGKIGELEGEIENVRKGNEVAKRENVELEERIKKERSTLKMANEAIKEASSSLKLPVQLADIREVDLQLAKYRRILIKDVVGIFKLRKVKRKVKSTSVIGGGGEDTNMTTTLEYRIVTVGQPSLATLQSSTLSSTSLKKINAFASYVLQFTILLSTYLGVILPYKISNHYGRPLIQLEVMDENNNGFRPLELEDGVDCESFIAGLATLNFNISHLCLSQQVSIPLDRSHLSLEMLARLCEAPHLGMPFPALLNSSFSSSDTQTSTSSLSKQQQARPPSLSHVLEYDVQDVINHHVQNSQKPWALVENDDAAMDDSPIAEDSIGTNTWDMILVDDVDVDVDMESMGGGGG